jgi:hypothetical protein
VLQLDKSAQVNPFGHGPLFVVHEPLPSHEPTYSVLPKHDGVPHAVLDPGYVQLPEVSQPVAPQAPVVMQADVQQAPALQTLLPHSWLAPHVPPSPTFAWHMPLLAQ